jgi:hypothetical protein
VPWHAIVGLGDVIACYRPGNRNERAESERFGRFGNDERLARDEASADIFWLRSRSPDDTDKQPEPNRRHSLAEFRRQRPTVLGYISRSPA